MSENPVPDSEQDLAAALRNKTRNSRQVSWLLDECIRIPGTKIRFGLDPILGLIPFGGETVATIMGASILNEAGKKGLPIRTLIRMCGNMLVNAGLGAIPGIGDVFSVWFKSNSRNYQMLNAYLESDSGEQAPGGWWPVTLITVVLVIALTLNILTGIILASIIVWGFHQIGA